MALRFNSSAAVSRETGDELGGAIVGEAASGASAAWPQQRIFASLLGATSAAVNETWFVNQAITSGSEQGIAWRCAGDLLYGVLELDEADFPGSADCSSLQAASREAYSRIFRLLDARGFPNLWRVWNYLAAINLEIRGLERYRQFNVGRQDAFLEYRRGAAGNVPAACALGLASGPLSIAFMAGRVPAVPLENPRQVSAYNYPADYGPRSPTFSRAALAYPSGQEILLISGTASIVGHRTVHLNDVAGQCRECVANIEAVLGEANRLRRSAPFVLGELSYRVYLRDAADFRTIREILSRLLGPAEICYVQADICRCDLLLEIEAHALHLLEN